MVKVAVIGAGAAGLSTCHHLLNYPAEDTFQVTVFEQAKQIGGTWVYNQNTGNDEHGYPIHSSMYNNLWTNLPKELMAFVDFSFPDDGSPSYLFRDSILKYLNNYCQHFSLQDHIKFQHRVVQVQPIADNRWLIQIKNLVSDDTWEEEFDAVAICNGHYATPRYSHIEGLSEFQGEVLHSHDYRLPDKYAGKNVVCLGAGSSGVDLVIDIAEVAHKVTLSHDLPAPLWSPFPDNVDVKPMISKASPKGITFKNGDFFPADALIFCTGYEYNFPFLTPECGIEIKDHRVVELYKHMINIKYPSMAFLSVPFTTVPFVVNDIQAQCIAKAWANPSLLPSQQQMLQDTREEMKLRLEDGYPPRHFHKFSYKIWNYLYMLEDTFGDIPKPLPKWKEKLHDISFHNRSDNFIKFRNLSYRIIDGHVFYR